MSPHRIVEPQEGAVHTKIVATVGPTSRDPARLRTMAEAGVDLFRLNFSHGTHDDHSEWWAAIRALEDELGRPFGILQDLGGPKIRLGPIPGEVVDCRLGDSFTLVAARSGDNPHELTCTYPDLVHDLTSGDILLFADGAVAMRVEEVAGGQALLLVTLPGRLRSNQGINLPGTELKLRALTDKDLNDLDWTIAHPVDYVGQSFVRRAADVVQLREELATRGLAIPIVAKIEKPQALDDLDAILVETDAVMVARGDLGVEIDVARVPAIQKRIIAACHRARVPVITATQMLNSMETSNRPTRAEASDVFNAVLDGTDAVMLSGETAIGAYPVEAVATMNRIVAEAEKLLKAHAPPPVPPGPAARTHWIQPITESVVEAASLVCRRLDAALLVVVTHSGRTALALSKHRHATPTLALTATAERARRLTLYWGVNALCCTETKDVPRTLAIAFDWARQRDLIRPGDRVVLVQGTLPDNPIHNAMLVEEVP